MSVFPQVGSFILASLVLLLADFVNAAPTVRVTPAEVIEGVPGAVIITGLKPGQGAVLHACRMWDRYPTGSEAYHGRTAFLADITGAIDLSAAPPQTSSGRDQPDPSRPFWSMAPVGNSMNAAPPACQADLQPGVVSVSSRA